MQIGRGYGVEVRLNDLSISRLHAAISFQNGSFYLSDMGSKFGSLVLLRDRVSFEKVMCVQVGNRVYKLEALEKRESPERHNRRLITEPSRPLQLIYA